MSLEEFIAYTKSNNIGTIVVVRNILAATAGGAKESTCYRKTDSATAVEAIVQIFGAHDPVLSNHPLIANTSNPP